MSEWIDVKDRLPEVDGMTVIIALGSSRDGVGVAWIERDENGVYWADDFAQHLIGITHWQPLPEPPTK